MTEPERKVARRLVDNGRREWVEDQGGYRKVEDDAQGHQLTIDRRCKKGKPTYSELEAENTELRRRLKQTYSTLTQTRHSRDVWYMRATGNPPGNGRGGSRRKKKDQAVDSRSTGRIG